MKLTKTHVAIAILIVLGALFVSQTMSVWPEGQQTDTIKCDGPWVDIGFGASAKANACSRDWTNLNIILPWGQEIKTPVYQEKLSEFRNPDNELEWFYVYPIGCSYSGTYLVTNHGFDDPCTIMPAPENACYDFDLCSQQCIDGEYIKDQIIEANSIECGCIIQETPNICDGYDLWSQKQTMQCVEGLIKDQLLEEKSTQCGYICTDEETKSFKCTDNTIIVTQRCSNNEWEDVEHKSCPLNWTNLEMILRGYIEDIKLYMEKIL